MDVDVRGADPPSEGIVRPRPQTQILAQKRAILEELDNPTGGLANAVKLVASRPRSSRPSGVARPPSSTAWSPRIGARSAPSRWRSASKRARP